MVSSNLAGARLLTSAERLVDAVQRVVVVALRRVGVLLALRHVLAPSLVGPPGEVVPIEPCGRAAVAGGGWTT